jgi:hypothetical protein
MTDDWKSTKEVLRDLYQSRNGGKKEMGIYGEVKKSEDFEPVPMGAHPAICIWVVSLGLQKTFYGIKPQLYLKFEIPGQRIKYERDGKQHEGPMTIGIFYNLTMSRKSNLRHDLEGWRHRKFTDDEAAQFDIAKVLGKPCTLLVDHKEKENGTTSAIISSIKKAPDDFSAAPENEMYLVDDERREDIARLPEWIQEKIRGAEHAPEPADSDEPPLDDDIPF